MEPLIQAGKHSGKYMILVGEDDSTLQAPRPQPHFEVSAMS